jgi:hypothetical protein
MKNVLLSLSLLVAFVLAVPTHAQSVEKLTTKADTSVMFGGNRPMNEDLIPAADSLTEFRFVKNEVNMSARHCQDYVHKSFADKILGRKGRVDDKACAADPSTLYFSETKHNLRTNAGGDWQASVMGNTSAPPATCNYIALSNDATAPSTSDTSVASEITTNGLARAQTNYNHTIGMASYTEQKIFSATGTQASQKAGLLNASSSGTLCFENTYT